MTVRNKLLDGVSVIICCYNSSDVIGDTLTYLADQEVSSQLKWEVLLVDNACRDDTIEVARKAWSQLRSPAPLRIVQEPTPGVSYARQTGIKQATYEVILFCDDDTWLSPNYVRDGYDILRNNPQVGAVRGWGEPVFCTDNIPGWLTELKFLFSCKEKPGYEGINSAPATVTMGLVTRRSIFSTLFDCGFRTLQHSRKGNSYSGGEDIEMTFMLSLLGYELWASPRLYYRHFITEERISQKHIEHMSIENGKVKTNILPYFWLYDSKHNILRKNIMVQMGVALLFYLENIFKKDFSHKIKALEYKSHLMTLPGLIFSLRKNQAAITSIIDRYKNLT